MAQTIPKLLQEMVVNHPDIAAQMSKDSAGVFHPRSFKDL
jgi:hypothetical protein